MPRILSAHLYCYVEPANAEHARTHGAKMFGSFSAYINALICKDRGVKATLGTWKAPGESKQIRESKQTPEGKPKRFTQMDFDIVE